MSPIDPIRPMGPMRLIGLMSFYLVFIRVLFQATQPICPAFLCALSASARSISFSSNNVSTSN